MAPLDPPPVTLKEMAVWLRAESYATKEPEATMLRDALASAIERVVHDCGPFGTATVVCHPKPRRNKLVLPYTRLTAVTEVLDPDGNEVTPYDVDLLTGIIELDTWPATTKRWTVSATPRETVSSLVLAVKIIASHLFEVNRGGAGLPGGRAYPSGDTDQPATGAGFALPRRATQLMTPYLRTGR